LSQKQTTHNPGHANGHSNKHQNEEEAGTVFPHSQGRLGVSHNPFSKATKAEIQQNPRDFQPPKKSEKKVRENRRYLSTITEVAIRMKNIPFV
jgi:hypothetical protein